MERTASISTPAKLLAILVALVVALAFMPGSAYAASSKTVKKATAGETYSAINKKATKVKKGVTNLTYKKGVGYVKFTATKTKTYTFTVSNIKTGNTYAYAQIEKRSTPSSKYLDLVKVKTQGGKAYSLNIMQKGGTVFGKGATKDRTSRYAKVKLKKGETAYLYYNSCTSKKSTLSLKIK